MVLIESLFVFQMFLRDAKQAEVLLNQQETFLSKEDVPVSCVFASLCLLPTVTAWRERLTEWSALAWNQFGRYHPVTLTLSIMSWQSSTKHGRFLLLAQDLYKFTKHLEQDSYDGKAMC